MTLASVAVDEFAAELLLQSTETDLTDLLRDDLALDSASVIVLSSGRTRVLVADRASPSIAARRFLVVPASGPQTLPHLRFVDGDTAIRRVLRAALTRMRPGMFVPKSWAPFHLYRYMVFYASTITQGAKGVSTRVVVETKPDDSPHILVSDVTTDGAAIDLAKFATPSESLVDFRLAVHDIRALDLAGDSSLRLGRRRLPGIELPTLADQVVAEQRTYAQWLDQLGEGQRTFLLDEIVAPTTLRGPAGTGKTLSLAMKALHEVYSNAETGSAVRVALVTHNWLSAETVRQTVLRLDNNSGELLPGSESIDVCTLHSLADEMLRLGDIGLAPLSLDGHDGKNMQAELIDGLLEKFLEQDFLLYRRRCSEQFRNAVTAPRGSLVRTVLHQDLINEFGGVLGADRGLTKESYVGGPRHPWSMPLPAEGDREVVFTLYERFRRTMHRELQSLSMFDAINDLLQYLDSNRWEILRARRGFDLVLTDEFHLFNKQEAMVFRYLLKDPRGPVRWVAALDPRQGPSDNFLGFSSDTAAKQAAGLSGAERVYDLSTAFRYTKQIDAVISRLEEHWTFDLGSDWTLPVRKVAKAGDVPTLRVYSDRSRALREALSVGFKYIKEGRTAAVVCLGPEAFTAARAAIETRDRGAVVLSSRDDTAIVDSGNRKLVIADAELVAGLQFDVVIVADASESRLGSAGDRPFQRRRVWSKLYLAISRARSVLRLHASADEGGLISLLAPAVNGDDRLLVLDGDRAGLS